MGWYWFCYVANGFFDMVLLVLLCVCDVFAVGLLWLCYCFAMVLIWFYNGFAAVLLWLGIVFAMFSILTCLCNACVTLVLHTVVMLHVKNMGRHKQA